MATTETAEEVVVDGSVALVTGSGGVAGGVGCWQWLPLIIIHRRIITGGIGTLYTVVVADLCFGLSLIMEVVTSVEAKRRVRKYFMVD